MSDIQERVWQPVLTKVDFVKRYAAGEFGNAAPTWNDAEDFLRRGYQDLCHIRNRVAGGPTWYNVRANRVYALWYEIKGSGIDPSTLYISAMAPTAKTLFQGEVMQTEKGLSLFYSSIAKPMREALAESSKTVVGWRASALLHYYMDERSYDWLQVLLDRYPFHVIEFSTYGVQWGTVSGYNTVFWEVRLY